MPAFIAYNDETEFWFVYSNARVCMYAYSCTYYSRPQKNLVPDHQNPAVTSLKEIVIAYWCTGVRGELPQNLGMS